MISGLDLNQTVDYVIEGDNDNPTVWKIGVVSSYMYSRISIEQSGIEAAYKLLQICIKGWENFDIPFSTVKEKIYGKELDVVPFSIIERLPLTVVAKLQKKANEINQITEQERKN